MWAEYELTLNMAAEFRDEELNDLSSLKKEITAVKAKIKSLGDVNVNAIEDYKEVSERYEFLKGQHDDIVLAEKNLLDVIEKLNVSMQEQFNTKFKEIQVMFDKVFKELFGGGRGALNWSMIPIFRDRYPYHCTAAGKEITEHDAAFRW